ncbi:MAG TPA: vWA domain-containing protein [Phycisphaerae bacterium]|nr:vWA domain-containing protein [Phycisphaerae bacterium]
MEIRTALLTAIVSASFAFGGTADKHTAQPTKEKPQPLIEVAFVLDTTGSMSGLIDGAKKKIWEIANQIVCGKPTPKVRMALIGYRDKGDEYVTKMFDLTDNIDKVYENLQTFAAGGGGDSPEHVNKALQDAIYSLKWTSDSENPNVARIIYLVGDYPPHNDYTDTPTSDKLAKAAIEKGICINTVLCGSNQQTRNDWQQIASTAEGAFFAISQNGGMEDIATPYDVKLAEKNKELMSTVVVYGSLSEQAVAKEMNAKACKIAAPSVASARASYMGKQKSVGTADLVGALADKKVEMSKLDKDQLPDELKGKTPEQQEAYLKQQAEKRTAIQAEINTLNRQRNDYIAQQKKDKNIKSEFDENVLKALKKQAARAGVSY